MRRMLLPITGLALALAVTGCSADPASDAGSDASSDSPETVEEDVSTSGSDAADYEEMRGKAASIRQVGDPADVPEGGIWVVSSFSYTTASSDDSEDMTETAEIDRDEHGNIRKVTTHITGGQDATLVTSYEHDDDGYATRKAEEIEAQGTDGATEKYEIRYKGETSLDDDGHITGQEFHRSLEGGLWESEPSLRYEYEWEGDELLGLTVYALGEDGDQQRYGLVAYDEEGRIAETVRYSLTGDEDDPDMDVYYQYSEDGRSVIAFGRSGVSVADVITVDGNGNIIRAEATISTDGVAYTYVSEYEYEYIEEPSTGARIYDRVGANYHLGAWLDERLF